MKSHYYIVQSGDDTLERQLRMDMLRDVGIERLLDLSIVQTAYRKITEQKTRRELIIESLPSVYRTVIGDFLEDKNYDDSLEVIQRDRLSEVQRILKTDEVIGYFMKDPVDIALSARDTDYVVAKYMDELNALNPAVSGGEQGISIAQVGNNEFDLARMRALYEIVKPIEVSDLPILRS